MDARTGTIETPLEMTAPAKPKWFRRPVTKGFAVAILLGFAAVMIAQDIYLSWRQQYWIDSANIPWSFGDIAAMQHGSASAAAAIPAFRGIPNVTVSYYDIYAADRTGIRAWLYATAIQGGGERHSALTTWRYKWHWKPLPDGRCGTANAVVDFRAHVTLPRMVNPQDLTPDVAQLWRSYEAALINHEARHLRNAYAGRELVKNAVRRSNCYYADRAGQGAINQIWWKEEAFDRSITSGEQEGPVFGRSWQAPRGSWQGPADS
jgi:predicted secreted Zn-dependent protease